MSFMTDKGRLELLRGTWAPVSSSAAGKLRIVPVVSNAGSPDPAKTLTTMTAALAVYPEYPTASGWDPTPANRPQVTGLSASQDDTADTASVDSSDDITLGSLSSIDLAGGTFVGQRVRGLWVSHTVGASPNNATDWPVYWIDGAGIEGANGVGRGVTFSWPAKVGTFADSGSLRMFNRAKRELLAGTWAPVTASAAGRLRVMPLIADAGTPAPDLALTTVNAVLGTAFDEYNGSGWSQVPLNRPALTALTASLNAESGVPQVTSLVSASGEIPLGTLGPATKKIQGLLVTYSVTSTPNNALDFPVWYWPGIGVTGANGKGNFMFAHWLNGVLQLEEAA